MRLLVLLAVLALPALAANSGLPVVHVRNFGMVNGHLLRGAEPTPAGLAELGSAGVKVVIDLRESGAGTEFEKGEAEKLGMSYTNVPFPPFSAPSPAEVRSVLNLITQNQASTVFLHCRRGKDRTGTVVACYRIQHDGWANDKALAEAKSYGMSLAEWGMRAFILHFAPATNALDRGLLPHP